MRKRKKGQRASAKRIAAVRKFDYLQNLKMSEQQKKMWNRKPYGVGEK